MNLTLNRFHFLIFGIIFIIVGLFWQNPIIGIIITLLLAITVFYDDKIPLLFLLIFIPVRPFLIVYNTGYKALGDILILFLLQRARSRSFACRFIRLSGRRICRRGNGSRDDLPYMLGIVRNRAVRGEAARLADIDPALARPR